MKPEARLGGLMQKRPSRDATAADTARALPCQRLDVCVARDGQDELMETAAVAETEVNNEVEDEENK